MDLLAEPRHRPGWGLQDLGFSICGNLGIPDKYSYFSAPPILAQPSWETGPTGVASNEWFGHEEEDLDWEGGRSPEALIVPT